MEGQEITSVVKIISDLGTAGVLVVVMWYVLKYIKELIAAHRNEMSEMTKLNKEEIAEITKLNKEEVAAIVNKFTTRLEIIEERSENSAQRMATSIDGLSRQLEKQGEEFKRLTEEFRRAK